MTVFDNLQNKVVAFETISKNKSMFVGNYNSFSGNMETYLVSKAFQVLEPTIKGKTIDLTHDHNNKSHGVIKNGKYKR